MTLTLDDATAEGWPHLDKERPRDRDPGSLGDLIRMLRNGMAHGNIDFLSDGRGQIHSLRIWNTEPRTHRRTWGTILGVGDVKRLLVLFVELVERRHRDYGWYGRGVA